MRLQTTKISILRIFTVLLEKNHRSYCWPTRRKIQELLLKYYQIDVSIFTIDKHLAELKDQNFIRSYRQYGRREDGTYFNKPSNRQLTKKALLAMTNMGIHFASWLFKSFFGQKGKYKRFNRNDILKKYAENETKGATRSSDLTKLKFNFI